MKKYIFILLLTFIVLTNAAAQSAAATNAAEISFVFTRQSGSASNQYAIWIEDAKGQLIKTLYAVRWTANGGFKTRPTSIPMWVKKSDVANLSKAQLDVISSATPRTGALTYTWDGTDSKGAAVSAGDYVLVLEGTLRWENQVYYRAPIALGKGAATANVSVEYISGDRDTSAERSMFSDVKVRTLR
jgi:hypothetical protein